MGIVRDIGLWLWHLLPANPILIRVVTSGGKRPRHLYVRFFYLLSLFVVLLILGTSAFGAQRTSLASLAKQSTQIFMWVSMLQLFLMCFIAPVFTAAAITQEKDSNTFNILLTTPLSSAQIIIGSLFSRLYFVWVLLLAGLPIFCITMLFGGVTAAEVFNSFALAATTALLTGSLAILISVAKVGTRRTIFSFFLGVAVYLLAVATIGLSSYGALSVADAGPRGATMSWLAPIHPFLSLMVITGQTPAPPPYRVEQFGWPASWMLAAPHIAYTWITTLASVFMIALSLMFVRKGVREGEVTWIARVKAFFTRGEPAGERRRRPRHVWSNPIAWREAATRASAGGRSAARYGFIAAGVLLGIVLLMAHEQGWWGLSSAAPAQTRAWLVSLLWIEMAVILLVVTTTSAGTLTRERESETMELLLTTPLTSKYIFAGMLRGLVSFVLPMIAVPTITLVLFSVADLVRRGGAPVSTPEAALLVPLLITGFTAVSALTGLYCSLQFKKTVQAVMWSAGIVMVGAGLLFGCGAAFADVGATALAIIRPFTPLHSLQMLVDSGSAFSTSAAARATPDEMIAVRVIRMVTSVLAIAVYSLIAWSVYNTLVRTFDMTVRRQSAST